MKKKLTFLGIETSCDETAAAVVQENNDGTADVLSNVVSSQIKQHEKFGGIVPEIAARAHIENIEYIIKKSLHESERTLKDIDGITLPENSLTELFSELEKTREIIEEVKVWH